VHACKSNVHYENTVVKANWEVKMGTGSHVLTFPVNMGQILNVVAFHTTKDDWPDSSRLTAPATREDALRDFSGFGPTVTKLLQLVRPNMYTVSLPNDHFRGRNTHQRHCCSGQSLTSGKIPHQPSSKAESASSETRLTLLRHITEQVPDSALKMLLSLLHSWHATR
jgi:hypothetical protein